MERWFCFNLYLTKSYNLHIKRWYLRSRISFQNILKSLAKITCESTYDSRIKAGLKAKIRPSSILIYNSSKTKKEKEMIVTPKENILIYFHLRQKNFVLCTHKEHFCRLKIFFRFLLKIAYFHQQNRGVSKIVCASTWHKKNILKETL